MFINIKDSFYKYKELIDHFFAISSSIYILLRQGSVESCTNVPVTFQFSPPKELAEVGSRLQFNTMLTLKGETIEQFRVNFVAEIVK